MRAHIQPCVLTFALKRLRVLILAQQFKEFINILAKRFPQRVGLCEPEFKGNEIKYLTDCIETRWVSTAGKYVTTFEEKIKDITGAKYAIATSTGTSALHTLYLSAGILPGDEVLTQSFTFIATVNAISYCNAIPHFIDISDNSNLTIDPVKLRTYLEKICEVKNNSATNKLSGRPIKALVVMHTFGKATQLEECKTICDEFGIILIEDAAEALGTKYNGQHVGTYGAGGAISFNGNKIITCGAGGVVITNNEELAAQARHLSTTGKLAHPYLYNHDIVAYNYRMANINAAVGLAQIENLPDILNKKKSLFKSYLTLFSHLKNITILEDQSWSQANHWLNAAYLHNCDYTLLLDVLKQTNELKVSTRPAWTPIHKLTPYENCPKDDLSVTNKMANSIICLPSSAFL